MFIAGLASLKSLAGTITHAGRNRRLPEFALVAKRQSLELSMIASEANSAFRIAAGMNKSARFNQINRGRFR
jgi:hypothetical protein